MKITEHFKEKQRESLNLVILLSGGQDNIDPFIEKFEKRIFYQNPNSYTGGLYHKNISKIFIPNNNEK